MPSAPRPHLLVNMASGDDRGVDDLLAAARDRGLSVIEVEPTDPEARDDPDDIDDYGPGLANRRADDAGENPLEAAVREAIDAGAGAIGMAGGDGSLGLVAQAALEHDLPFVCIPFGTRNHFARDLGLDRDDPLAALEAFDGVERRIDVGRVNGRVFLNNVTFGLYAEAVHEDEYRDHKIRTVARVGSQLLKGDRDGAPIVVDGEGDAAGELFDTPFALLVSNGCYELDAVGLPGARERLDGGVLHVCVIDVERGSELLGLAATATGRKLEEHPAFHQWTTARQRVRSHSTERIKAGVDGEAAQFDAPIDIVLEPAALRVLVPRSVAEGLDAAEAG